MVDHEKSTLSGKVQGAIAAGLRDADICDGAIAIDCERDFGVVVGADRRVDRVPHPILADARLTASAYQE